MLTTFAALVFFASNSVLAVPVPQVSGLPSLPSILQPVPVVGGLVSGAVGTASGLVSTTGLSGPLGNVASNVPIVGSVIRRGGVPTVDSIAPSVAIGTVDISKLVGVESVTVEDVVKRADDITASADVPVAPPAAPPVALPSVPVPSTPVPSLPVPSIPMPAIPVPALGGLNPMDIVGSLPIANLPVVGPLVSNVLPSVGGAIPSV
jgi:hypothetical protein